MKLKKNIVDKYNSLFIEIAGYYNKSWELHYGYGNLFIVYATDLGYSDNIMLQSKINNLSVKEFFIYLSSEYPYLVPFYKLYLSQVRNSGIDFKEDMFKVINGIIRKIRIEKWSRQNRIK